jgi:hypothetical protein
MNVRVYNGYYPSEVAGIILVDSSHMDERDSIPQTGESAPAPALIDAYSVLVRVLRIVGLLRVITDDPTPTPPKGVTAEEWRIATSFEPQTLVENAKELFIESAREARAAPGLGDRPLIILTAGRPPMADSPWGARRALAGQKHWIEIQGQLAKLSTNSKQVVVQAGHCIHCDAPESVIESIAEVLAQVRQF